MNDFYVGYIPHASPRTARFVRRVVGLGAAGVVAIGVALVLAQHDFPESYFEFGKLRELQGVVETNPYPVLRLMRADGGSSRYVLVGEGKHGALVDGFQDRPVRLTGTLIYRDGGTLVEVKDGSLYQAGTAAPKADDRISLGHVTLRGQIVDSKCYFGVMNPGDGKVHRACAVRCVSGGIPPAFVIQDGNGRRTAMLLTGARGERVNSRVLDMIAEPVEIEGELWRSGDLLTLASDPRTYRRIGE